jgi:hypothetical protein
MEVVRPKGEPIEPKTAITTYTLSQKRLDRLELLGLDEDVQRPLEAGSVYDPPPCDGF